MKRIVGQFSIRECAQHIAWERNTMEHFINWLVASQASEAFKNAVWFVPTVQIFHILAISVLFSSMLMIDMRIWGWAGMSQGMSSIARRYLPWAWGALGVLVLTGSLLIVAEPDRELNNVSFWIKMSLLALGLVITAVFQQTVHRNAKFWDQSSSGRGFVKFAAVFTLLIWAGVIVSGRMIAYSIAS